MKILLKRFPLVDNIKNHDNTFIIDGGNVLLKKGKIPSLSWICLTFTLVFTILWFWINIRGSDSLLQEKMKMNKNVLTNFHSWIFSGHSSDLLNENRPKINDDPFLEVAVKNSNKQFNILTSDNYKGLQEKNSLFINEQCSNLAKRNNQELGINFACESRGAKVLSTLDTEPYGQTILNVKFLGINLVTIPNFLFPQYFYPKGPSCLLKDTISFGDCWAFKGAQGKVQIELSKSIFITSITVHHLSNVDSAPKSLVLFGIIRNKSNNQIIRIKLDSFEYKKKGPPLQKFFIGSVFRQKFRVIEIDINDNHGNGEFTCVYRFGIFGYF